MDLVIRGTSCRIYYNNDNFLKFESKNNLISWSANKNILIDRYDCRASITNTEEFVSILQKKTNLTFSNTESQLDQYRYANIVDWDDSSIGNEKIQNSLMSLAQYDYKYETYGETSSREKDNDIKKIKNSEKSEPFSLPIGLNVPHTMILPESNEHHLIIETTAKFIAQHGIQMEIIIKTKQSHDKRFSFLNFDHELHEYYKHLIDKIKSGEYIIHSKKQNTKDSNNSNLDKETNVKQSKLVEYYSDSSLENDKCFNSANCEVENINIHPLFTCGSYDDDTTTDDEQDDECLDQYSENDWRKPAIKIFNFFHISAFLTKDQWFVFYQMVYSNEEQYPWLEIWFKQSNDKGLIIPNNKITKLIMQTRVHVMKLGRIFENSLLLDKSDNNQTSKQSENSKISFNFIDPNNIYYRYYVIQRNQYAQMICMHGQII